MDKRIVGVDVSKDWLDGAIAGETGVARIANTPMAIAAWLDRIAPDVLACEPTGGWERTLRKEVRRRGAIFVSVHPNQIIAFRSSRAIKAKTDAIDAMLIAAFTADELARRGFRPTVARDDALTELAARRRQLVDALHAEHCRRELADEQPVRNSIDRLVASLTAELKAIEAELTARVAADPERAHLAELLQSLKGAGPITALTLIADLPELGQRSGKEIASLVGLAPQTRNSGKTKQQARTGHGRPNVRRVLFNAARSAIRYNPIMKTFYNRLVSENKRPGKVALVAVMRKMLVTLNAIARDRQPWRFATDPS